MKRLLALLLALLPLAAPAQESAVLVADNLVVTSDERLVASGNVQAYYEGTTLSAAEAAVFRATPPLGIILFARNIADPAQLVALNAAIRDLLGEAEPPR